MRDAGRLAAAIDVLTQIDERHRPVRMALKNWGEAARYALDLKGFVPRDTFVELREEAANA